MILDLRPSFAEEFLWWSHWLEREGRVSEAEAARAVSQRLDPAGLVD